jgi:hypothetical protein
LAIFSEYIKKLVEITFKKKFPSLCFVEKGTKFVGKKITICKQFERGGGGGVLGCILQFLTLKIQFKQVHKYLFEKNGPNSQKIKSLNFYNRFQ